MSKSIGELIRQRRTESKMTLRDISEVTELSIGYLSQPERGLTSIAHGTLRKIARALGAEITYFMERSKTKEKAILRSYEREILHIEGNSIIEYATTNMTDRREMLPKLVKILPQKEAEELLPYPYEREEFIYALEDVLALQIEDDICDLYPGDYTHYKSTRAHNWNNQVNKVVKLITINTSNFFQEAGEEL